MIIYNGGEGINDCPKDWNEAHERLDIINNNSKYDIKWSFDCGYKLDYDGQLVCVSARFYPPKTHYGDSWDGTVHTIFFDNVIEKNFKNNTLTELVDSVESYITEIETKITNALLN